MNKKTQYMHTVNGQPAHFDGEQVIYGALKVRTVPTLAQIRREQKATRAFRESRGYADRFRLGYVCVAIG